MTNDHFPKIVIKQIKENTKENNGQFTVGAQKLNLFGIWMVRCFQIMIRTIQKPNSFGLDCFIYKETQKNLNGLGLPPFGLFGL